MLTVPPGKYEMLRCPMCIKLLTMGVLTKNLLLQMAWKRFRDSSNRFCIREEREGECIVVHTASITGKVGLSTVNLQSFT